MKIYISQGSVATQLRCLSIFSNALYYEFSTKCVREKLKIGQYLAKIRIKVCGLFFFFGGGEEGTPCIQDRHMDMDISMDIHAKSVDMDMDMDGKIHIHGNPEKWTGCAKCMSILLLRLLFSFVIQHGMIAT